MFLKNLFNLGKQYLGFGKGGGLSGMMNKAKNFLNSSLHTLNSKPIKSLVSSISSYFPSVGDAYKSLKKYGHQANNLMSGGVGKHLDRYSEKSPVLQSIDRAYNATHESEWHRQNRAHDGNNRSVL